MKLRDMIQKRCSKMILKVAGISFATVLLAIGLSGTAQASCGTVSVQPSAFNSQTGSPNFVPAAFRAGEPARGGDDFDNSDEASIVGMWNVKFLSYDNPGVKDGTVLDFGLVQWHSDGTEIMNSGTHPPMTSNFCMGVFKKTGPGEYHLNHYALPWSADGQSFAGVVHIVEDVVVDEKGDSYSGTFTLDQYDPNGNHTGHATGRITAVRITAD